MYTLLRSKGFSLINHIIHEGMDYSDIKDFRDKRDLSHQIVNHDLQYIEKSDVILVIANGPSYGTAIEMYAAKNSGKKSYYWQKMQFQHHGRSTFLTI